MSVKSRPSSEPYWMPSRARKPCRVHLAETDGVASLARRIEGTALMLVCSATEVECADRRLHRVAQAAIHRLSDVENSRLQEMSRSTCAYEVLAVCARLLEPAGFRAQVGHGHATFDRVRAADRVLEHDVRVADSNCSSAMVVKNLRASM